MILSVSFISNQGLLSKNAPNLFWLSIKQSYNVSKNPLRTLIWIQKSIEFHLPHYEIPQLSSRYCRVIKGQANQMMSVTVRSLCGTFQSLKSFMLMLIDIRFCTFQKTISLLFWNSSVQLYILDLHNSFFFEKFSLKNFLFEDLLILDQLKLEKSKHIENVKNK